MHPHPSDRCGLSTLELVLSVPMLLLVMALMINFGTAACWKARTLIMGRQMLWNSRIGRSGDTNPRPAWWPSSGSVTAGEVSHAARLDDSRLNQPVARGPMSSAVTVHEELLDPTRGMRISSASLSRSFPMLAKTGDYQFHPQFVLVDGKWTYTEMGIDGNDERRIPVLYVLAKASKELADAYVQAVVALLHAPIRAALKPLDRDEEFIQYGTFLGWDGMPSDFHPRLEGFCSTDRQLADQRVLDLIDRIQGNVERDEKGNIVRRTADLAEQMTRAFVNLYEEVVRGAGGNPSLPSLRAKIDILNQFLQALIGSSGGSY